MRLKQVYPGRYMPDTLLSLIEQEKVTFSHCMPTILHMLLTCPAVKEVDLSGWTVIIGGSALPKGLAKLALDMGIDIFGGNGLSETCPILSLAQLKPGMTDLDYRPTSMTQTTPKIFGAVATCTREILGISILKAICWSPIV